jgi:hypothetical protein
LGSLTDLEELGWGVRILGVVDEIRTGSVDEAVSTSDHDDLGIGDPGPEGFHVGTFHTSSLAEMPKP